MGEIESRRFYKGFKDEQGGGDGVKRGEVKGAVPETT
jgi:hypothetical protein